MVYENVTEYHSVRLHFQIEFHAFWGAEMPSLRKHKGLIVPRNDTLS